MAAHPPRSSRSTGSVPPPKDDASEFLDDRVGMVRCLYGFDVLAQGFEGRDDGRGTCGGTVGDHLLGGSFFSLGICWRGRSGRESRIADSRKENPPAPARTGPLRARDGVDPRTRIGANRRGHRHRHRTLPQWPVRLSENGARPRWQRLWHLLHFVAPTPTRGTLSRRVRSSRRSVPSDESAQFELPTATVVR